LSYNARNRAHLSELAIRTEVTSIQRDLGNQKLKFTAAQRYHLHVRIETLQAELKALEIERLEDALEKAKGSTDGTE
jgi:hypothetical protein